MKITCKWELCGKQFLRNSSLYTHVKTIHEGIRFKCNVCKRDFSSKQMAVTHEFNVHGEGENTVRKCETCGEEFRYFSNLNRHIKKIHQSPVMVKFTICSKEFTVNRTLKLHMESVHEKKRYACDFCNKTFAYEACVIRHKKSTHENLKQELKCNQCNKSFTSTRGLRYHIETNHEEKHYRCDANG